MLFSVLTLKGISFISFAFSSCTMDDIPSGLDPDELMELDEPDGSDLDEDEDDLIDDPVTSPFLLSSGQGSTATSVTSSPPNNDDFIQPFSFTGKPLNIKRGRGRPRRAEGGNYSIGIITILK